MKTKYLRQIAAAVCVLVSPAAVAQQTDAYPSRPVRMIVPNAPGGSSDFVARIVQPKMSELMGVQVVIDNRGGASGNIGVEVAGRAAPDGYTLLLGNVGAMATGASYIGHVKAGKLRMLAVVSPKRIAAMPDVPTMVELGYPELNIGSWQGLYVPAKTPRTVVSKLHEALMKTLRDGTVVDRLAAGGADVITSKSPEECAGLMKTQLQFWGPVIKRAGVTAG